MTRHDDETWTWLALAGLGAFHGLNPGMGWLFAVALGLHRHDRRIVWLSAIPIALGHALSVAIVAGAFVWAGLIVDRARVAHRRRALVIGWALYHWRYGHRHRVRFGMRTGLRPRGLVVSDGDRARRRPDAVAGADAALRGRGRRA